MHVIEWVTKTVNRDGKNLRLLKSQKINLFESFLYFFCIKPGLYLSYTLPHENYVPLTYETKIIRPGRFFHWKVKVVRELPTVSTKTVIRRLSDKLNDLDLQDWHRALHDDRNCVNGNKLRTYRTFKQSINPEAYVTSDIPRAHRRVISAIQSRLPPDSDWDGPLLQADDSARRTEMSLLHTRRYRRRETFPYTL